MALLHYPVVNKNGDIVSSAVTNLDLHDMSRAARTYGVSGLYVVTPLADQKQLTERIVSHWVEGGGATYNPKRGEALKLVRIRDSLEAVAGDVEKRCDRKSCLVATSARVRSGCVGYTRIRNLLQEGIPCVLVFGTAWGLAETVFDRCDYCLKPVAPIGDYNHLSVRSAAAIILDRLLGGADGR